MINLFLIIFSLMFIVPSIFCFVDGNILQSIILLLCSLIGIIPLIIINSKKISIKYLFPVVFLLFGVVVITTYYANINIPNKKETIAEVISIEKAPSSADETSKYYPTVKYEVNSKIYSKEIKSQFGSFVIGEKVELIYNEQNPNQANLKPSFLLVVIGISFTITGFGLFLIMKYKNNKD